MFAAAAVFAGSVALLAILWSLRVAELAAGRRFFLAEARHLADERLERWAATVWRRTVHAERAAAAFVRALPHYAGDLAAIALRFVATRSLRLLRWLHEKRAPKGASRGSVSFFVSALGEARRPADGTAPSFGRIE